jgi:arginyl-tRNA synthetase/REP element-mobilizing transposase RayT
MRIAYSELAAAIGQALGRRNLAADVRLLPIEPPREWGVTCNACFTLGAQHAAAQIAAATAGLDKKAAKEAAGRLAREAGLRLAAEVAAELEQARQAGALTQFVARVEAEGAYLNFYYDARALAELMIATATLPDPTPDNELDDYGSGTTPLAERKQIMVEYAQPNTHKDFHVGHLRNASIGQAIANLLEFAGHKVYKATYLGDVGAHVAKALYGSRNLARDGADALDYWGRAYKRAQDAPNDELVAWLNRWEAMEPGARQEWQHSRDECVAAFQQIFGELQVDFHPDCWFYESTVDDTHLGQQTAEELKRRGVAVVDESEEYKGALYVDFAAQADAVRGGREELKARQPGAGTQEEWQPGTAAPLESPDSSAGLRFTPGASESGTTQGTSKGFSGAAVPGCHSSEEEDKWQGIAPALIEDFHMYRRRLPHWRQTGRMYFVTWRQVPGLKPFTDAERDLIASVIRHFDGERYFLYAFVVMDDHVHVLVQPQPEHSLAAIEHSWKSYAANRLQREHGRQGQVWQDESFDRIVRDEEELHQKAYYILTNPQRRWGNEVEYKWVYLNQEWPEWEDKAGRPGMGIQEEGQPGTAAPLGPSGASARLTTPDSGKSVSNTVREEWFSGAESRDAESHPGCPSADNDPAGQAGRDACPTGPSGAAPQQRATVFTEAEQKRIRQLGKMTILRSNGTSLYQTKELGLAKYKFDWVKEQTGRDLDESLYVVGAEQKLYFEQVFAILRLWGFPNADKCKHIAYELVVLPEGKMSSREGTVVSYRELRDAAIQQATEIIREKGSITAEAQVEQTARAVAIAAIKYTMLQVSGNQQIVFDFAQALSFDGRAAPYLQYAYARAGKLVGEDKQPSAVRSPASGEGRTGQRKAEGGQPGTAAPLESPDSSAALRLTPDAGESTITEGTEKGSSGAAVPGCHSSAEMDLHPSEIALARLLSQFPETCRTAAARYEPAILCNYLYACADAFSAFYRDCRVLDAPEPERGFRRGLTRAFRYVMKAGFRILALPLPEAM